MSDLQVTRADRMLGLLLSTALGDALGAPFEGAPDVAEDELRALEASSAPLAHTDDTALTVVLAEHLADGLPDARLEEDVLAREFAATWRAEPWRGYGAGAAHVFRLVDDGVSWQAASRAAFGGQGSYGNGVRCGWLRLP